MNFFCTKKHYDAWTERMGVDDSSIFCLSVDEAIQVSYMLFNIEE